MIHDTAPNKALVTPDMYFTELAMNIYGGWGALAAAINNAATYPSTTQTVTLDMLTRDASGNTEPVDFTADSEQEVILAAQNEIIRRLSEDSIQVDASDVTDNPNYSFQDFIDNGLVDNTQTEIAYAILDPTHPSITQLTEVYETPAIAIDKYWNYMFYQT